MSAPQLLERTRYEWTQDVRCGSAMARFLLMTIEDWVGMDDGIPDSPDLFARLAADMEATEAQVEKAMQRLCQRGIVEFSWRVSQGSRIYATGWRLCWKPPVSGLRSHPPSTLEQARRAFNTCPGRLALRAEIAAGTCKCPCGETENLHVDHIFPLARGGSNDPENLQVLCGPCNTRKGARVPQWALDEAPF